MYKYETHMHTSPVSKCATATVRDSLIFYKQLGYDGVFVTNPFLDGNIGIDNHYFDDNADTTSSVPYEERIEFYFSDYEQLQISNISSSIIDDNSQSKDDLVFISVYDYIKNNTSMILSGFINFRLKDYIEVLEYLVDLSVNNFIINREYDKFITLLRDYINSEPSKIDVINLVYLNQEAILLDKNKNIIPIDNNIVDSKYLSDISFSNNDYVLNTVLNLLPNKLYVHVLSQEDEFLKTLKNIFSNKISFCYDCEICNFYKTTFADSKNKSND